MKKKPLWLLVITLGLVSLAVCLLVACSLVTGLGPKENCEESHDPMKTRTLRICTDKREYDFGAPISVTFTVTNVSDQSLVLDGGDKPAMDVCVAGECWSDGRVLTRELTRVTLEPGESHTIAWSWPTPHTHLEFHPGPEIMMMPIPTGGIVIHFPGASERTIWVNVYYHQP